MNNGAILSTLQEKFYMSVNGLQVYGDILICGVCNNGIQFWNWRTGEQTKIIPFHIHDNPIIEMSSDLILYRDLFIVYTLHGKLTFWKFKLLE